MLRFSSLIALSSLLAGCGDDSSGSTPLDARTTADATPAADAPAPDAGPPPTPTAKGPYDVGTMTFTASMTGDRQARVQAYYPTTAPPDCAAKYTLEAAGGQFDVSSPGCAALSGPVAAGPFPLIVLDHGGGLAGADYQRAAHAPLVELLASHGFIVVLALHSADATNRIRDLGLLTDLMLARSADGADAFGGRIDAARVGAAGFSAGAAAAFNYAAGRTVAGIARDARVKALVVYEPARAAVAIEDSSTLPIPFMVMAGSQFSSAAFAPQLFTEAAAATRRLYVKVPGAAHLNFQTGLCHIAEQAREAAITAEPELAEPLTTLTATSPGGSVAYTLWNQGQLLFAMLGIGFGGGRNICNRLGVTSTRSLDADQNGFTDDPPFYTEDPTYTTGPAVADEVMQPLVKLYTVAFWKTFLAEDPRYMTYLTQGYATAQGLPTEVQLAPQ